MSTSAAAQALVVDDDDEIRAAYAELLTGRGYAVVEARHGAAALELLASGAVRPVVVLLDLAMPVMNGWELLSAARPQLAGVPVIVISGDEVLPGAIERAGAARFL